MVFKTITFTQTAENYIMTRERGCQSSGELPISRQISRGGAGSSRLGNGSVSTLRSKKQGSEYVSYRGFNDSSPRSLCLSLSHAAVSTLS